MCSYSDRGSGRRTTVAICKLDCHSHLFVFRVSCTPLQHMVHQTLCTRIHFFEFVCICLHSLVEPRASSPRPPLDVAHGATHEFPPPHGDTWQRQRWASPAASAPAPNDIAAGQCRATKGAHPRSPAALVNRAFPFDVFYKRCVWCRFV